MKPAHTTELLLILLSAIGGIVVWNIEIHWIWKIIIGTLWFSVCSRLAGQLKQNVLDEYITATQNLKSQNNTQQDIPLDSKRDSVLKKRSASEVKPNLDGSPAEAFNLKTTEDKE